MNLYLVSITIREYRDSQTTWRLVQADNAQNAVEKIKSLVFKDFPTPPYTIEEITAYGVIQ